jgi:hypothetical protein
MTRFVLALFALMAAAPGIFLGAVTTRTVLAKAARIYAKQ